MNFVLDNSVVMRWYFGDGKPADLAYATRVLEALKDAEARVPDIWNLEVANVLARAEAKALVTEARSEVFIGLLSRLNIVVDGETSSRAWGSTLQLARRYQLSAYDAAYLELALRDGLPLATLDVNVMKAARRAGVEHFDIKPTRRKRKLASTSGIGEDAEACGKDHDRFLYKNKAVD